jgi:hypothetical protein
MQRAIVAGCMVVALVCRLTARGAERTAEWNALVDVYLDIERRRQVSWRDLTLGPL